MPKYGTYQKKQPGVDYETNPQKRGLPAAAGKGTGYGIGIPARGGRGLPSAASPMQQAAPPAPQRYGSERGPKPSQFFRPSLPQPRAMDLGAPKAGAPSGGGGSGFQGGGGMYEPGQKFQQGGQAPFWFVPPGDDVELGEPDKGAIGGDNAFVGGLEPGSEWEEGQGWQQPDAEAEVGQSEFQKALEALGTGFTDGGMPSGSSMTEEEAKLAQILDTPAPQLSQDYEKALLSEFQAEQAANLKQLYEQAGAAGTGASGSFAGPLEGLLTAGSVGAQGLKADIEFKNKEMQADWYKMKTQAFLQKWGKSLDAQQAATIAGAANELDAQELGIEEEKLGLQEEGQETELKQQLADSLSASWANTLEQYEGEWQESTKGIGQMGVGKIMEGYESGDLTYGEALAMMEQLSALVNQAALFYTKNTTKEGLAGINEDLQKQIDDLLSGKSIEWKAD